MGAQHTVLSELLILAARSRLQRLSVVLVGCGARVDHRHGRVLDIALQQKDFGILDGLFATECPGDPLLRLHHGYQFQLPDPLCSWLLWMTMSLGLAW